ncbi:hypothetical protein ACUOFC_37715, partial [Escherichia sp. TWPC-MK]
QPRNNHIFAFLVHRQRLTGHFGRAAGLHLQESIAEQGALRDASESDVEASLDRLNRWNNNRNGEDPVAIRKALQECMQHNFSVFREGDAMAKGLEQLKVIRERLKNARLDDTSSEFNIRLAGIAQCALLGDRLLQI